MDLILWRSMVVAAQRRDVHEPRAISWQARFIRLLRPMCRAVAGAMRSGLLATRPKQR
jgi:hypothetical protein